MKPLACFQAMFLWFVGAGCSAEVQGPAYDVDLIERSDGAALGDLEVAIGAVPIGFFDGEVPLPLLGRVFEAHDHDVDAPKTVVLSYEFWQRLGGSPDVIGSSIRS